jgi:hypothetical protein
MFIRAGGPLPEDGLQTNDECGAYKDGGQDPGKAPGNEGHDQHYSEDHRTENLNKS